MNFENFLSGAASYLEKEALKKQKAINKKIQKILRESSDAKIKQMYKTRYENPNWDEKVISLIEKEAHNRGIR